MRRASHLQFQGTTFPLWRDPSMRSAQRPRQPQPPRAAVPVGEGMDRLELVVEHARLHQGVMLRGTQPVHQVRHHHGYHVRRRSPVDEPVPRPYADTAVAVASRILLQTPRHHAMGPEEALLRQRVQGRSDAVAPVAVQNFPDMTRVASCLPTGDREGHLLHRHGVVLYGRRCLGRGNHARLDRLLVRFWSGSERIRELADFGDKGHDALVQGEVLDASVRSICNRFL